jgi:subtilisin family serine protease
VIGWKDTLSQCARGLKVGVIDTDIDEAHPTFGGRHIHRFDFSPDGRLPAPNWHGTAVLSLLAGGSVTSTPGLIPDADFYAANVFYSDEHGDMAADTISLLKALDWMKKFDVKLINMSFSGPQDALVGDAIARMSESGVIFVAAAGNEGPTAEPSYPAAYPQVIAVTAVTKDLRNYRYANRGPHIEFSAPGVDIWTAAPGGGAGFHSGTSFAAPHVTAVLAVEPPEALQEGKADLLDNLAVMDLGQEGRDPIYGRGLLLAPSECTPPEEVPETAVASAAE